MTTLTERGQVSMPAALRAKLGLQPGQRLLWKIVSENEFRVLVVQKAGSRSGHSMRGFMKRYQKDMPETTSQWMDLLREGERA